jgi:adenylosuccinate synthase
MSATIILGAQWGDEGKVRQLSPPLQGQEPLALDRWAGHIHSLTRTALLHRANLRDKQGKIVDVLCNGIQLCCRAQGGHNAGHTIVKDGTTFDVHILRKLPSFAARDQPLTF